MMKPHHWARSRSYEGFSAASLPASWPSTPTNEIVSFITFCVFKIQMFEDFTFLIFTKRRPVYTKKLTELFEGIVGSQ